LIENMNSDRELWILVHGTFAADARWIGPDSELSRILRATGRIDTESFRWSGSNSGVARARAGRELAVVVASRKEQYSSICVIGHSHGGNVIRQACRDLPAGAIRQAIFLGTPFINAERRDLAAQERMAPWLVAAAVGLYFWNIFAAQLMEGGFSLNLSVLPQQTTILLGISALVAGIVATAIRRAGPIAERNFAQRHRECRTTDHVFQVGGDEAALLLHTMSFLPNIGLRLMRFLTRTVAVAAQHVLSPFPILAIPIGLAVLTGEGRFLSLFGEAMTLLLLSIMMGLLLFLALALAWVPISALLRFVPVSFGYEGFASLIGLNLAVETAPWTTEAQKQHNYRVSFPGRKFASLRHSGFYEDPAVIGVIAALARGSKDALPDTVTEVQPPPHLSETPPKKWSAYILPAFLFGVFSYTLMIALLNPLLVKWPVEEVSVVCEWDKGCEEIDSAIVDKPFESGCTVQPDGSCIMERPQ
jgi:hypothetical protein